MSSATAAPQSAKAAVAVSTWGRVYIEERYVVRNGGTTKRQSCGVALGPRLSYNEGI